MKWYKIFKFEEDTDVIFIKSKIDNKYFITISTYINGNYFTVNIPFANEESQQIDFEALNDEKVQKLFIGIVHMINAKIENLLINKMEKEN